MITRAACRRFTAYFTAYLLLAICTACASLPEVRKLRPLPAETAPTIADANGKLTDKKAESLIAKRWSGKADIKNLAALEEAATGRPLIAGNKVTLLYDGPQTMSAMLAAIATAKNHIHLETYIFDQDELGLHFADSLIAKQRAGVSVKIIYDSVGTIDTPATFFDRMRQAGIELVEFNPVNPLKRAGAWELNNRDHRKILIVDGTVAFTGGVNISKTYAKSSLFRSKTLPPDGQTGWRDTHIKIEGPAVAALQWLFLDTWVRQKPGAELQDRQYFPPLTNVGDKLLRVIGSKPGSDYEVYKSYVVAIENAKKSIHLTASYFVPDAQLEHALMQAARRGIDVKIIVPGVSDVGVALNASRSFYDELLDSGIKLYQMQVSVLHAKTAVIDGVWSTIGSTNIDMRSFLHNDEVSVVVLGEDFGRSMESAFQDDLKNSHEITKQEWTQRPFGERLKEWTARMWQYWL